MTITWRDPTGPEAVANWIAGRIAGVFGAASLKTSDADALAGPYVYRTVFRSPKAGSSDLRKAAELALGQLMPVKVDELIVFGRRIDGGAELAAVRKSDAEAWEADVSGKQPKDVSISSDWCVQLPRAARKSGTRKLFALSGVLATITAFALLYLAVWNDQEQRLEAALEAEARARIAALEVKRAQSAVDLWTLLKATRAEEKTADRVLGAFAGLSAATPDGAYWKRIEWSPARVLIEGYADDALGVLEAVSNIPGAGDASFSRPVSAAEGGPQSFEILISRGMDRE